MITLRKLRGLAEGTRNRKLFALLKQAESLWAAQPPSQDDEVLYWRGITDLVCEILGRPAPESFSVRAFWELRQLLGDKEGLALADWDFQAPADATKESKRFPFSVYLEDVRSPFNVGSILRTAEAYGFQDVFASPLTPSLEVARVKRSAMGCFLPFQSLSLENLREVWNDRPVFALELGGKKVQEFEFPAGEALVLLGSEELGLSSESLAWAEKSWGRVSLPLYGRKASLNVGVAFGILAAHWTSRVLENSRVAPNPPMC